MSSDHQTDAPRRIEIDGDILIPDADFCDQVLAHATRRTAQRLDKHGLPFVMVAGSKWRPINEGRRWLAGRIVRKRRSRASSG